MWRLRISTIPVGCAPTSASMSSAIRLQFFSQCRTVSSLGSSSRRHHRSPLLRRAEPYGITIPCAMLSSPGAATSGDLPCSSSTMITFSSSMVLRDIKRLFRAQSRPTSDEANKTAAEATSSDKTPNGATEGEEPKKNAGDGASNEDGAGGEKKAAGDEAPQSSVKSHMEAFKRDYHEFPDIYNSANAINFVLFTIFCLCSTGSNVEAEWWINQFGIDAAFRPLAWFMHSLVMNNFLSMTFAMMLLHSMCHSVLPTIGSAALFQYCAIISVVSGVLMWAFNYSIGYTKEKQFGPWDMVAGLFVMQFLHQGFLPWQIINSFNGWVRYACWVGAVCILYYDPQPTALGTAMGFALCRFHPRFKPGAAAAAAGAAK